MTHSFSTQRVPTIHQGLFSGGVTPPPPGQPLSHSSCARFEPHPGGPVCPLWHLPVVTHSPCLSDDMGAQSWGWTEPACWPHAGTRSSTVSQPDVRPRAVFPLETQRRPGLQTRHRDHSLCHGSGLQGRAAGTVTAACVITGSQTCLTLSVLLFPRNKNTHCPHLAGAEQTEEGDGGGPRAGGTPGGRLKVRRAAGERAEGRSFVGVPPVT